MHSIVAEFSLRLYDVDSLKDKRSFVKGVLNDLKKKYNISVIESGNWDNKTRSTFCLSFVANSVGDRDSILESIRKYLEKFYDLDDFTFEVF
jgi:uncharacterized protein YlxP (DUF503 family)